MILGVDGDLDVIVYDRSLGHSSPSSAHQRIGQRYLLIW
jgi:hypothetical protein